MNINSFWTNSIWYILLGVVSIILLSYILIKSKRRKRDLGFFFAIVGLTFIIETIIYVFLRAYEYYPLIIPGSPADDGVMGNILSQFLVSTAALFICSFEVPLRGVIATGGIFYLIEKLFLGLGIYKYYWYRTWMTFVGFIILFEIIKKWYKSVVRTSSNTSHYFTIMLGLMALYLPTTNWIAILFGYFVLKVDSFANPLISHAVIAIPKYIIQMNLVYFLYKHKANWVWNITAIAAMLLGDAVLYYAGIVHVKEGWLLVYSGISILTIYLYVFIMNKLLYSKVK